MGYWPIYKTNTQTLTKYKTSKWKLRLILLYLLYIAHKNCFNFFFFKVKTATITKPNQQSSSDLSRYKNRWKIKGINIKGQRFKKKFLNQLSKWIQKTTNFNIQNYHIIIVLTRRPSPYTEIHIIKTTTMIQWIKFNSNTIINT